MLQYDEWVVPGEVEYAEQKAVEIEAQIRKYHETFHSDQYGFFVADIYIRITEHIIGIFEVKMLNSLLNIADIDVHNYMKLDWFQDTIASIDPPKIFDLPADDIRRRLPDWDESLLPDNARRYIMDLHSLRYIASYVIDEWDSDYSPIWKERRISHMEKELNISREKLNRTMEAFVKKLDSKGKVSFSELEEKIGLLLSEEHYSYRYRYQKCFFPMIMREEDIIDAIREAYENVSIRSRRIMPNELDEANLDGFSVDGISVENYECLYQGKAWDLRIRFLFDFKKMKITMAYPVLKEIRLQKGYYERHYYDKKCKMFFG